MKAVREVERRGKVGRAGSGDGLMPLWFKDKGMQSYNSWGSLISKPG